jgi:hypothetical protein
MRAAEPVGPVRCSFRLEGSGDGPVGGSAALHARSGRAASAALGEDQRRTLQSIRDAAMGSLKLLGARREWTVSMISALSIRFEIGVIRGCSVVEIAPSSRHRLLNAEDGVKFHGGHLTWPRAASQL